MIYGAVSAFVVLLAFTDFARRGESLKYVSFIGAVILLVVFAGARGTAGTDTSNYLLMYSYASFPAWSVSSLLVYIEPGFQAYMAFLRALGVPPSGFVFVTSAITIITAGAALYRLAELKVSALALYYSIYFYVYVFSGFRQGMVLSVILWCIVCLKEGRRVWFWILIAFGFLFHRSIIVLAIAYPFARIKWQPISLLLLLLFAMSASLFAARLFSLAGAVLNHLPSSLLTKFNAYTGTGRTNGIVMLFSLAALQRILLALVCVFLLDRYHSDAWFAVVLRLYVLGTIVYFLGSFSRELATRLTMNTKVLEVLILPAFVVKIQRTESRLIGWILLFAWGGLILYSFIWSGPAAAVFADYGS